jgi:hypothetical protein
MEHATGAAQEREKTLKEVMREVKTAVEAYDFDIGVLKKESQRHEDEIQLRARVEYESKVDQQLTLVREMKDKMEAQDAVDLMVRAHPPPARADKWDGTDFSTCVNRHLLS